MLQRLITPLFIIAAALTLSPPAPSEHFQERLIQLQRQGSCSDLPLFGVSTHQKHIPDNVNIVLASAIYARVVRADLPWIEIEQHGHYEFQPYDNLITELRRANKSIVLVLAYGHPDHSDGLAGTGMPRPPRTPVQRAAYNRYVRAVAERYHGPDIIYEIWNEPNFALYWPPAPDDEAYGALLTEAVQAIRDIDPKATVISGGLANVDNPSKFINLLAHTGALARVDGMAFHPYRQDAPENGLSDIAQFQRATQSRSDQALWITEWGYSASWSANVAPGRGQQLSATMIARLMLTTALAGAKATLVYDLIDDGTNPHDPESNFGLYDHTFKPKPAAIAFRTIAGLASSCDTYEFKVDLPRNIITAAFYSDNDAVSEIIWTYAGGADYDICFTAHKHPTELSDVFGHRLALERCGADTDVKLTMSEAAGPLILRSDGSG